MALKRKIELIYRSGIRLMSLADETEQSGIWWEVLRREAWLHLRRTVELLWLVLRKKQ